MALLLVIGVLGFVIFYFIKIIRGTVNFIFKPSSEQAGITVSSVTDEETPIEKDTDEPLKIQIKNNTVDTNKIIEYQGEEYKKFSWYPQTFKEFIGQENAKEQAKTVIKKMIKGIKCHMLLSALQGHGKSTYIRLLAKNMNAKLIERVGKEVDEDSIIDIINEINTSKEKYVIFFLDEIDTTDWKVLKLLNPILQDFRISGKKIKPFCFCSATINKDILLKTVPDLLDRIPHAIQFKRYTAEEMGTILTQYKNQLYSNENISNQIIKTISNSCKFNPRLGLGLLEDFVVTQDIQKTLRDRRIVYKGLTEIDVKILEVLNQATRAMGSNALAMRVGINERQYLREYEPNLVEFDYVHRIPSRIISEKGKRFLEKIKNEKKIS